MTLDDETTCWHCKLTRPDDENICPHCGEQAML